ncbi:MAG: hypothetical protein HETSPECPRED_000517 [Heterodermia speciosa]|uniref:Uncharacterized protein n=1 Tax=Heterodermia speciosa TaxID=116794 RepID=A0A8H3G7Q1_9LECA|nr:MAG: hypothetical protein HETSPECPRED_000517 [Heterodermia speciosa]
MGNPPRVAVYRGLYVLKGEALSQTPRKLTDKYDAKTSAIITSSIYPPSADSQRQLTEAEFLIRYKEVIIREIWTQIQPTTPLRLPTFNSPPSSAVHARKTVKCGQIVDEDPTDEATSSRPVVSQALIKQEHPPTPTPSAEPETCSIQGSIGTLDRKRKSLSERYPAKNQRMDAAQQSEPSTHQEDVGHSDLKPSHGTLQLTKAIESLSNTIRAYNGGVLTYAEEETAKWQPLAADAKEVAELQDK